MVVALTLFPALGGSPPGMARHVAVLFPVFLLLGRAAGEGIRIAVSVVCALGLALATILYVHGFWIG